MDDRAGDLLKKKCKPCTAGDAPMTESEIARLLPSVPGWSYGNGMLTKTFHFPNYWQTVAFVNASAWISHREDHHPALTVGYNQCRVDYWTHAVNGISENDFICAANLDALFAL